MGHTSKEEKQTSRLRFAKAIPKRGNTAQSWTWGGRSKERRKTEPPPKEKKQAIRLRFAKAILRKQSWGQSWTWGGNVNVFGGKQAHTRRSAWRPYPSRVTMFAWFIQRSTIPRHLLCAGLFNRPKSRSSRGSVPLGSRVSWRLQYADSGPCYTRTQSTNKGKREEHCNRGPTNDVGTQE